jgi:hypothetical protein
LLTDSAEELQGALQQLLFTKEDEPRWDRLEELLERADSVTDYSLAEAAERLLVYVRPPLPLSLPPLFLLSISLFLSFLSLHACHDTSLTIIFFLLPTNQSHIYCILSPPPRRYLASDTEASARLRQVIKKQVVENSSLLFEGGASVASNQIRSGEAVKTAAHLAATAQQGGPAAVLTELVQLLERDVDSGSISGGLGSEAYYEQLSRKMPSITRLLSVLSNSSNASSNSTGNKTKELIGILRQVLKEPKMAQLVSEIVAEVFERNSSRVIEILLSG